MRYSNTSNQDGSPPSSTQWIEDKFYKPEFYSKFPPDQRKILHELGGSRPLITIPTQNVAAMSQRLV